jgi:hypothetical protein
MRRGWPTLVWAMAMTRFDRFWEPLFVMLAAAVILLRSF